MREHGAAGHAERCDGGVNVAQPGVALGVHGSKEALADGQQIGVVAGRQRSDEPDAVLFDDLVIVGAVLSGVVDHGQRLHVGDQVLVAGDQLESDAEFGFRQLKDPHVVSFSPMHHWTDSKIRVHVFYCVLALAVAHLMRRHAQHSGLQLSVRELLNQLAGIPETVLLYHDGAKGCPRVQRILTDMDPTQRKLADLFDIHQYAPTR